MAAHTPPNIWIHFMQQLNTMHGQPLPTARGWTRVMQIIRPRSCVAFCWKWKIIRDQKVGHVCMFIFHNRWTVVRFSFFRSNSRFVTNFVVRRATWQRSLRELSRQRPRVQSSWLDLFWWRLVYCTQNMDDDCYNCVWVCVFMCVSVVFMLTLNISLWKSRKKWKSETKWWFCYNGIRA